MAAFEVFTEEDLRERMFAFRRRHGLNQRAAAKQLGVDPITWWRWESGRRRPEGPLAKLLVALIDGAS